MARKGIIRVVAGAIITAGSAWVFGPLGAEPMAKEACDAAEAERATLIAAGVPETVKKGPGWAKANLGPAKFKDVERYIALQEQLLFKCGHAKLRTLPIPDGDEAGDGLVAPKDAAAEKAETPPVPKRKPAAKKPEPRASEAAAAANQPSEPQKPAAKPRAKPKPKPDDAYKPPQKPDAATE